MDKEKSVIDMFLEGESNDMFKEPENIFENVSEEPKEKEGEPEKEDKPLPFHKDPKIQKYLDRREKEIEERLMKSVEHKPDTSAQDEFQEVVSSFENIIGNDTPEKVSAINSLKKALITMDERSARRAEEKIYEIKNKESEADREAEEELENAFDAIEDTFDVDLTSTRATKLRQEFVTFVEKIAPKDREGNVIDYPDMVSAWETFSEIKKSTAQPSRAKEIASRSMSRSTESAPQQPKRVTWDSIDEMMDGLK